MRKALPKADITPLRKEHYANLKKWLASHPQIKWRKLLIGFEIDTRTIPSELVDEFIEVCTFVDKK